ncbi:MAG: hypothetical protein CM15mV43_280 [uncultured marine virus]|nr:MAG: hypothetical protein CM15mV43_280 [uncultured marine virus]
MKRGITWAEFLLLIIIVPSTIFGISKGYEYLADKITIEIIFENKMGSRPSAPVTYRPTPTAPVIYQSVIPEEDFERARDYVDELKAERAKKKKDLDSCRFWSS